MTAAGDNTTEGANGTQIVYLNFTEIWVQLYDLESVSVSEVIQDLNRDSDIYNNTLAWYVEFFGVDGVITLNITGNATIPVVPSNSTIPKGLEPLVAWIE